LTNNLCPIARSFVEGRAELVHDVGSDDVWRDQYRRIASRYVDPEGAEAYVANTINEPRGLYRVKLDDADVKTWRMPLEGEDGMGIWHNRYYQPNTRF
jgi:hypothetical protein